MNLISRHPRIFGAILGILIILSVLSTLIFGVSDSGRLIAKYFPVVGEFQWEGDPVPDGGKGSAGWQIVSFKVNKFKSCKYIGLRIYWIADDGFINRIPWTNFKSPDSAKSRPSGKNVITIRIGSTLPRDRWILEVLHECHWWLPLFETRLWPLN